MSKSLMEQLPEIVEQGRQGAGRILESLKSRHRLAPPTHERVLPTEDAAAQDLMRKEARGRHIADAFEPAQDASSTDRKSRLIYGDSLLAMAAMLERNGRTPSLRGKIDLIYIDPPFDSRADYRTREPRPGVEDEQKPVAIEQFADSDARTDGAAAYLRMIAPRLILMRELLADAGSIYVNPEGHAGPYVKAMMDKVFGKSALRNEIIHSYNGGSPKKEAPRKRNTIDTIYWYTKGKVLIYKRENLNV